MASRKGIKLDDVTDDKLEENLSMRDFSNKVTVAHSYIKEINLCTEKLHIIKGQIQSAFVEKEKQLSMEIEHLTDTVTLNQQKTKALLDQLQEAVRDGNEEEKVLYYI
jgi:hypothetical protein